MAYNIDLEYRIDKVINVLGDIIKKKMFGGVGYLMNGNMCFGIHKDYVVIQTSIRKSEELLKSEYVTPFDITGRPVKGWLSVSPDAVRTEDQLLDMLQIATTFVKTLPQK